MISALLRRRAVTARRPVAILPVLFVSQKMEGQMVATAVEKPIIQFYPMCVHKCPEGDGGPEAADQRALKS